MAIWGLGAVVGPVLGPTLGGWLTDHYSWRWVFYINVPFGVLAFLVISSAVPETKINRSLRFDVFGFAMLSLAVAALQMFLDRGELKDWFGSTEIVVEAVLAGVVFFLFLRPPLPPGPPLHHPTVPPHPQFPPHLFFFARGWRCG